jgi:peptidoglycan hydrolase CwlO-like protein
MRRGNVSSKGMRTAGILKTSVVAVLLAGATVASALLAPAASGQQKEADSGGEEEFAGTGSRLKEAQSKLDVATSRTGELKAQTEKLSRDLEEQREAANDAQERHEERIKASYKGGDLSRISLVLNPFLDSGASPNVAVNRSVTRLLSNSRGSIQFHKDSQRALKETKRQLDKKRAEYENLLEERRSRVEELGQGGARLKIAVDDLGSRPEQMETRISELAAAEKSGAFTRPPASGGGGSVAVEQEFEIAKDIVARPVEPIPHRRYVQVYKAAAKRYGFAEDWYVLAAVGRAESNHGENMGPSSAGALGPMQFLPSTWEQYGVDGNGDGEANILDPEDAIPAAASYLEFGGAPEDWHAALYTYNHAGWYVREVLGIAESYRRQAGDEGVGPYV